MNMEKKIIAQIRQWHLDERRSCLKRTFELGDMLLKAVIHSGLTEYQVICNIVEDLGDLAMGTTSYNRAARLSRVFTANQRAVLMDKCLPIEKCETLAGKKYDGRQRVIIVRDIKLGKIKSPWRQIKTRRVVLNEYVDPHNTAEDSGNNPDNVVIPVVKDGEVDEDRIVFIFQNIMRRVGKDTATRLWKRAVLETK